MPDAPSAAIAAGARPRLRPGAADPSEAALRGAPAGLAARVVALLATGAGHLLLARALGVAAFGRYASLVAVAAVVALIAGMQLDAQAARARGGVELDRLDRRARRSGLVAAVVFAGLGTLTTTALAPGETIPLLALVPLLVARPRLLVLVGAARAAGRVRTAAWLTAATPVLRVTALATTIAVARLSVTAAAAIHGAAVGVVWLSARRHRRRLMAAVDAAAVDAAAVDAAAVDAAAVEPHPAGLAFRGRRPMADARRPRRGSRSRTNLGSIDVAALVMAAGAWLLVQRADLLMLRMVRGAVAAGEYEAALRVTELPQDLYAAAIVMFVPAAARLPGGDLRRLAGRLSGALTALLAPLVATLAVFGADLVEALFGAGFTPPGHVAALLVGGSLATILTGPVGALMVARRRHRTILRISLVGVGLNLALNALLIPPFGAGGAAAGTALSLVAINGAYVIAARRELHAAWLGTAHWVRSGVMTAVALAVAVVVRALLGADTTATAIGAAACSAAIALALTGVFARRDLLGLWRGRGGGPAPTT